MPYTSTPGYKFAKIYDLTVYPQRQSSVYHGTSLVSKEKCINQNGLPMRGNDIDLIKHVEPPAGQGANSAFIGTVYFPESPAYDDFGAATWADEGGWVYHIQDWPGYDVNCLLAGRIKDGKGGFRSPHMCGEQEIAIPAMVPRKHILRIGKVERSRRGLTVTWGK